MSKKKDEELPVLHVNGIKAFRTDITDILAAIQNGQEVHVKTYTQGRKPQSIIKLAKIEDLLDTNPA